MTMYTEQGNDLVDFMFPPLGIQDGFDPEFEIQEFSSFGFWREVIPVLDCSDLDSDFSVIPRLSRPAHLQAVSSSARKPKL